MSQLIRLVSLFALSASVDMRIPKANNTELRIRPDAMKRSVGFGLAWPEGGKAKELQGAYPPASGIPD